MAVTKRTRNKPCKPRGTNSKGVVGAKRHPLTPIQKVLAGKGQYAALVPTDIKTPWRGLLDPSTPVFDAAQVEENKRLYPHLFAPEKRRSTRRG